MMDPDLRFRLEAAARVLERAASRHPAVAGVLRDLAARLREAAERDDLSVIQAPEVPGAGSQVERLVEEIRRWLREPPRRYCPPTRSAVEMDFFSTIFRPLRELEKKLEELDRALEEILP